MKRSRDLHVPMPQVNVNQRKKKLLYLALCDPDLQVTGATVRMGAFVKHLAGYYEVALVNMGGSGYRVSPEVAGQFPEMNGHLGITQRTRIEYSQLGYFLFSRAIYRTVNRLLQTQRFDYLLADYGLAALYGAWFAKRYGVPLIYSSHNVEYRMYLDLSRHDFRRALLTPYVYWAERAACRAAALVVAISENDGREYAKWIESDRIKVIPQGFDPELCHPFYPAPPSSPAVVLFIGNFRSEANRWAARRVVKDILPAVLKARPDTKFQFVGAEPPADLSGPNVECPGFVDDLVPYCRRANLVITPMPFPHGMVTKVILALAFGKTVLSTPEGASAIPQKYQQLVVAPIDAFASRIVAFLSEGGPPRMSAREFKALCDSYAWPPLMAQLYQSIEQTCASSKCLQPCGS